MRSALFLSDDENMMNRIKITVHDEAAQFYYCFSVDDAANIMDETEIAVVFMPYGMDVLSGDEMIEIIKDHNPRAQIILLFDEEDLTKVIKTHNTYQICKLICTNNMKLEELPDKIAAAFERYNKDEELRNFELDYRKKEDKYKQTLEDMAALLNDRMESYSEVRRYFLNLMRSHMKGKLTEEEFTGMHEYVGRIFLEFISLYLLREPDPDLYLLNILSECHKPDARRFLRIQCDGISLLRDDQRMRALFVIRVLSIYFSLFYSQYRGRIETEETEEGTILNILYECIPEPALASLAGEILPMNEDIVRLHADRSAFGTKEKILQYKLIYKKADQ